MQALPPNPIRAKMMQEPDYDDGGVPRFYTFVLDSFFDRVLPLIQPDYGALVNIPGATEALGEDYFLHSKDLQ